MKTITLAFTFVLITILQAAAQQPAPAPAAPSYAPGYGTTITLEQARKVASMSMEEARKNNWLMAVAIVEPSGTLVYFEKMDGTQYAGVDLAITKARTSAMYRRATRVLAQAMAQPENSYYATFPNMNAGSGGTPIAQDGKIIGAVGISGGTGAQDHQVATAGAAAIK
jgi:glc operon protein GlcG